VKTEVAGDKPAPLLLYSP